MISKSIANKQMIKEDKNNNNNKEDKNTINGIDFSQNKNIIDLKRKTIDLNNKFLGYDSDKEFEY